MIRNYIKLAWRLLGRKKFFTFISLFGISFTLGLLMVIFSFLQGELGTDAPMGNKDDFVIIETLRLQKINYDTIPVIDTLLHEGIAVYDTTFEYKRRGSMRWNSSMNNDIGEQFLRNLPSSDNETIFSSDNEYDVYVNGIKLSLNTLYSDANYWEVFNHEIIAGRAFDKTDVDQVAKVALISTTTAKNYFGSIENVIDQEIEMDGKNYKIIGLYPDRSKIIPYVSPDIVIPYTNMLLNTQDSYYHGFFSILFQKKGKVDAQVLKDEITHAATLIPLDHPSKPPGYNEIIFLSKTYNEMFANGIYNDEDPAEGYKIMKIVLFGLLGFFIILPTLNLINLNVSRILERSSEIGVRKAFGAHQGNIITQFIVENILQTIIGGIIGLGIAIFLISLINKSGFLGATTMTFNGRFFLYSFVITILFGIISGFLPAYRMSKLNIVNALKENKI